MLHTATKLALAPLLLAQALNVRRKALLLSEPPGPREGRAGNGPPLRLLILGDSSAAGVGAAHQGNALSGQLARVLAPRLTLDWTLWARTGATSASTLAFLRTQPPQPFDAALVILGVNDVTRLVPPARFLATRRALHDTLRTKFNVKHILASGLPPMGHFPLLPRPLRHILGRDAARLDTALAKLCTASPDCTHIPLALPYDPRLVAPDGFHPSEPAYTQWAEALARHLP